MTSATEGLAAEISESVGKGYLVARGGRWQLTVKVKDPATGERRNVARLSGIEVAGDAERSRAERELMRFRDEIVVGKAASVLEKRLREEAERAANPIAAEQRARLSRPFGEYALGYYDGLLRSRAIEKSTHSGYAAAIRKRLAPRLGDIALKDISIHDVEEVMASLAEQGYSRSTLRKDFNLMRATFAYAVTADGLASNPTDGLKPPTAAPPRKNALDAPTTAEMLRRLGSMKLTRVTFAARLALNTGLALEEVCGLTWLCAPRPGHECVEVRQVIGHAQSGLYVKDPKRASRARRIPTNEAIDELFAEWREACDAERARKGRPPTGPADYVIGIPKGSIPQPSYISKGWAALSQAMGLVGELGTPPTFHDLRHTFTTRLVASGTDIRTVAAILGHSAVQTTLRVYTSVDQSRVADAMARVGGELSGAGSREKGTRSQEETLLEISRMLESLKAGQ